MKLWMLFIVLSSRRGSLSSPDGVEATMRPQPATVLRPACPATSTSTSSASPDNGRPLSRPPLYSPHWPIVPCLPRTSANPVVRRRGAALCTRVRGSGPGPSRPGQGPIVRLVHCAAAHSQSFLWGKLHEDQWWPGARTGRDHCQIL